MLLCGCSEADKAFLSTLSLRRATVAGKHNLIAVYLFLSTLSLRRATPSMQKSALQGLYFYPRSPCGERHTIAKGWDRLCNFYPRSPCGERQAPPGNSGISLAFLSTLSLRRATAALMENTSWMRYFYPRSPCGERRHQEEVWSRMNDISIHALLAESDNDGRKVDYALRNFYPRSPCGERPTATPRSPTSSTFLSTLSLRRATSKL